jgi:signal recognition particle GTPase
MEGSSFFQRLKSGLTKSRENWAQKIGAIFQNRHWDEESLETMEENLIAADLGPAATQKLMDLLRRQSPGGSEDPASEMSSRLQQAMVQLLQTPTSTPQAPLPSARPWVIIFLGVNGVGKTTTIGKLAAQYRSAGRTCSCGRRHFSRSSRRATRKLGATRRSWYYQTAPGSRSLRSGLRRNAGGEKPWYRRPAHRYGGTTSH